MPEYYTKRGYKVTTGKYKGKPKARPAIARSRRGRRTIAARTGYRGPAGDAKYIDIASATYVCDTTGSITHISVVPQGSTVNERDGKAFRVTSLMLRGLFTNNTASVQNEAVILVVWDRQPNKALAAITDVLDSVDSHSMNKRENASRFVVIRRISEILTGKSDGTTVSGYAKNADYYIKLPRDCICECTGSDTTGEIANRVSGALLFISLGNGGAGDTAARFIGSMRLNFQDI